MKGSAWVIPAAGALFLWGCWGFFQKLATNEMPLRNVYLLGVVTAICAGAVMMLFGGVPAGFTPRGTLYALGAGISSAIAIFLFLLSVKRGSASVVITFTALYPLVTILLSFLVLHESITARQGIGIVLAMLAIVLLVK